MFLQRRRCTKGFKRLEYADCPFAVARDMPVTDKVGVGLWFCHDPDEFCYRMPIICPADTELRNLPVMSTPTAHFGVGRKGIRYVWTGGCCKGKPSQRGTLGLAPMYPAYQRSV